MLFKEIDATFYHANSGSSKLSLLYITHCSKSEVLVQKFNLGENWFFFSVNFRTKNRMQF